MKMKRQTRLPARDTAHIGMERHLDVDDDLKAKGKLTIVLRNEITGEEREFVFDNLVTTVGKNHIAARMKDTGSPNQMSHMAVGTNNTSPAVGDTALGVEIARVALSVAGGTVSGNQVEYQATFGAGTGTGALVEAGIFNAAAAGTLLCRTTYSVINKGAADSMTITWTVTIS